MTSGPRRFRSGYRSPATNEWVLGTSDSPDAIVGYYDPDADQWAEGVADIDSGEWIPVDAVRGSGGRDCPPGFPVKGNLPSRVFHSPGQANYDRTTPEVCFTNEAAARDAGFRHARRRGAPAAAAAGAAAAAAAPVAAAAAAPVVAATAPRPDAGTPHATAAAATNRSAATERARPKLAVVDPRRSGDRRAALVVLLPAATAAGRPGGAECNRFRAGCQAEATGHRRHASEGEPGLGTRHPGAVDCCGDSQGNAWPGDGGGRCDR